MYSAKGSALPQLSHGQSCPDTRGRQSATRQQRQARVRFYPRPVRHRPISTADRTCTRIRHPSHTWLRAPWGHLPQGGTNGTSPGRTTSGLWECGTRGTPPGLPGSQRAPGAGFRGRASRRPPAGPITCVHFSAVRGHARTGQMVEARAGRRCLLWLVEGR